MRFQLEIIKTVPPGDGFGYHEGKAVFVPETTPGDVVEVSAVKQKKQFIIASLERVISPGKDRIQAPCPHYESCGGCSLMHLSADNQANLKQQMLKEVFNRQDIETEPLYVTSPLSFQSRYRAKLQCREGFIGFSAKNSHRVTPVTGCSLLSPGIMEVLDRLSSLGRTDCEFSLLHSHSSGELAVSVSEKRRLVPLPGYPSSVIEDYGNGPLRLNSDGFAQSNPFITKLIIQKLEAEVEPSHTICELYCGSGTFSIPLALKAEQLVGFDISSKSTRTAEENAAMNRLDNTSFIAANLEKEIKLPECDCFVADPPRKGLSRPLLSRIGKSKASGLLYVSCNPATLARDAKTLTETYRFSLTRLTGFDMYCHSTHSEALAIFER